MGLRLLCIAGGTTGGLFVGGWIGVLVGNALPKAGDLGDIGPALVSFFLGVLIGGITGGFAAAKLCARRSDSEGPAKPQ